MCNFLNKYLCLICLLIFSFTLFSCKKYVANYERNTAFTKMSYGNLNTALVQLEGAVKLDPTNPYNYLELARAYELRGDKDLALSTLYKSVELGPHCAECVGDLGRMQVLFGDNNTGITNLERALILEPKTGRKPGYYYNLGIGYKNLGDFEKSLEYFLLSSQLESECIEESDWLRRPDCEYAKEAYDSMKIILE